MDKTYKQMLEEFINNQVIDVQELESYHCHRHNQNFARFAEPDDEDWNVDEEWNAQCEQAIQKIKDDGLWEWTNIPDKYQKEAIEYIIDREVVR